jgi:hypothetical protein
MATGSGNQGSSEFTGPSQKPKLNSPNVGAAKANVTAAASQLAKKRPGGMNQGE